MRWIGALLAVLLGASPIGGARGEPYTVAFVLQHCNSPRDLHAQGLCSGFVAGVADALVGAGSICIPARVNNSALTDLVVGPMNWSAGDRSRPAAEAIRSLLLEAYPCRH